MDTRELILAALAAGGEGAVWSPVQVQKMFFVLDREAAGHVDGPHFNFIPHDFGPYDAKVYSELERLAKDGLLETNQERRYRTFVLTNEGFQQGATARRESPPKVGQYLGRLAEWTRSLPFEKLVSAIFRSYPDMRVNSVFRS